MHDAWVPLLLSLKVAGWATALDLVLGVAAGYALAR
ncbi:molybdate ABC transporter permease subunit, partial [Burkholderia pseudomallei]|nr:molybdate ABC transporter permease subunit [Burkholderia pseudomallei]MBF3542924.1 molybdate ABC transporter permease subunit [Burkholderia pseudomallei]MBF3605082.1 molybdate ABC transporter permease subunit [Burkholderia pseudomallei]MBF3605086.1 molybdate ABC transporter permease subunit [Burkholderia pseudomallei]